MMHIFRLYASDIDNSSAVCPLTRRRCSFSRLKAALASAVLPQQLSVPGSVFPLQSARLISPRHNGAVRPQIENNVASRLNRIVILTHFLFHCPLIGAIELICLAPFLKALYEICLRLRHTNGHKMN